MQPLARKRLGQQTSRASGVSLIELIIALVIVGISATTIASLLITALNFSENNQSYAERLRAAESCYETLLAVGESGRKGLWKTSQPAAGCSSPNVQVTSARLSTWTKKNIYKQLFGSGGTKPICVTQQPTCEPVKLDGIQATKFTIPIQGKNNLQLIVP